MPSVNYGTLLSTEVPQPYNKIGDGPEGPEVRTSADKLQTKISNKIILGVQTDNRIPFLGLEKLTFPVKIIYINAYAKWIIFHLENDLRIVIALIMTGRFSYTEEPNVHIVFQLNDMNLFYSDQRLLGNMQVVTKNELYLLLKDRGPDLLQSAINESTWISPRVWLDIFLSKKSRRTIYAVLLDQNFVSGIGNYLASDILYHSRILPMRELSSLSLAEWETLRIMAHRTIALAYSQAGHTIESFISPDGQRGGYNRVVYKRKFCPAGYPVQSDDVRGGRKAFWVTQIQI